MRRVTRLAIVGALVAGLLGLAQGRSPLQPLSAASGRSLLRGRPTSPLTAITPPRVRLPILDRLLRPTLNQVPGGSSNPSPWGLRFDGVDDRVTFGAAPGLNAAQFTLELWFMREGAGKTASTSGSAPLVTGVPLITKGVAEVDGSNKDANYFFAIDGATGTLAADFEDMATGANHPVFGTTKIWPGVWYHAAATYNGRTWVLYLNGVPDVTLDLGSSIAPRSDSIQHAGLGAAFNSTGVATGAFQGQMDEVRIWNVARTQAEIQAAMGSQITTTTPGLLGRWGLDEGTSSALRDG